MATRRSGAQENREREGQKTLLLLQPPNTGQRIVGALRCQTAQRAGEVMDSVFLLARAVGFRFA
jgi:hypothetical protein